jgi:hypothetical protein
MNTITLTELDEHGNYSLYHNGEWLYSTANDHNPFDSECWNLFEKQVHDLGYLEKALGFTLKIIRREWNEDLSI